MSKTTKAKREESKYRVIPNLTPRGTDILRRIQNRSLKTEAQDETAYTENDEVVRASRLSKKDLINKARDNQEKIIQLERDILKIQNRPKPKPVDPPKPPDPQQPPKP